MDADGHVVGEAVSEAQLMPVAPAEMEQEIELKNPNLWSIDAPYMYKVESILKKMCIRDRQNVSEIAYQLGFNNPKYFSKYFKDEFGVLPSVYQEREGK